MLLKNSFRIHLKKESVEPPVSKTLLFSEGNLAIYSRIPKDSVSFFFRKLENYVICLQGNFYLDSALSIDTAKNLDEFSEKLNQIGVEAAISCIRGGLFSLAVYDKKSLNLYLKTDNMGINPLFYRVDDEEIEISDNQFSISSKENVSYLACIEYLKFGYLPFSPSLFENIQRLMPEEFICIHTQSRQLTKTDKMWYKYVSVGERHCDIIESTERIHIALESYFSLMPEKKYMLGLSGGYDSRLILAFLSYRNPELLHFQNRDNSRDTNLAKKAAELAGLSLNVMGFPQNALALFHTNLRHTFRNLNSLEYSHLLFLHYLINEQKPAYYVDGCAGDTILGGTYYFEGGKDPISVLKYIYMQGNYNHPFQSMRSYEERLYSQRESVTDFYMQELIGKDEKVEIRKKMRAIVQFLKAYSQTHEDLLEAIGHYTRTRCLLSTGPTGSLSTVPCLVPFLDREIKKAALDTSKDLRSMDRLYNHYWNQYHPEFSRIRRSGTGGKASSGNVLYRLQHVINYTMKKLQYLPDNSFLKRREYISVA
ncbi:MAG: hypothetical protein KDK45_12070, partial [Leptospiraceae bacterium]|nr:hypothetical protein [Leptospiraceae bacterium]